MADTTTTKPAATPDGRPPESRSRSVKHIAIGVVGAAVAVAVVVALALVGTSHSKKIPQAATTTLPAGPSLAAGSRAQTVTYTNTMVPFTFDGMSRPYLLSRPLVSASSTVTLPVIVVLHGRAVDPSYEQQRTDFTSVVTPSILVYPTGYHQSWNAGNCCGDAQATHLNDVGYVRAVIAQVKQTQSDASPGKVYMAGYSNGGKMALTMACDDPDDLEAVAVFGATEADMCPTRQPVNLLEMAGTLDNDVPASNVQPIPESDGFRPPSFLQQILSYRDADGCGPQSVVTRVGSVTLTSWVRCADDARVGQAIFANTGHDWPAGSSTSPSGEGVMWAWFSSLGA